MNKKETQDLKDKVILITGATRGLGRELALYCVEKGAMVILLGRDHKLLEKIYDEIQGLGKAEPFAVTLDLYTATESEFDQLAFAIKKEVGRLDAIVHCAGYFHSLSPIEFQMIEDWMNQYRVNAVAPMALSKACLPLLAQSEDASIVFVGEDHSENPKAYWGGFGASYAGLNYLSKVAADEWEKYPNLRVNVIEPGNINSPLRTQTHPGETIEQRKKISDVLPDFVYWLSNQSKGKTGNIIKL